ncbi:MAG: hypothetical protein UR28_C0001G0003 [Candidatus Peregrinibacteria bacterium GW2011_GWF2_33_10]|nr:MAG: hypothetical protein UR28_C0001G0003 [Candidatus Peregrinibacteria bacterium GW2011_GWF2_33_10]OGJ44009.1 MAG: hypothetical protein A2263_01340 [Candidatus Peregrinibacteria bacterium RIFOXYA2_FULL_33_21]OGJ47172.1 MAG: hypothetical protein A2272_05840 [Candidatus Peregrinibacteria bacterium RIFOXYA12_FULL_33_12]OGJ49906.1 MAG: hypothetical protein A2307_00850 [Candidatus Peregrinibacteria bacterium RIFOXYB2_FULL_33_20]
MSVAHKNGFKIPNAIKSLCWSVNGVIDLKSNAEYIIHQVLALGDIQDIEWLFQVYDRVKIEDAFLHSNYGKGLYIKSVLNFLTKFIFKNLEISKNKYNQMLKKVY